MTVNGVLFRGKHERVQNPKTEAVILLRDALMDVESVFEVCRRDMTPRGMADFGVSLDECYMALMREL